jgi:hypothetical protein
MSAIPIVACAARARLSILMPPFRLFRPNMTVPLQSGVSIVAGISLSDELPLYTREQATG